MIEVWKDVVGYESFLQISNLGRVFSKRSNKILRTNKRRYEGISFKIDSKCIWLNIHRMVATAFIPNIDDKPFVNHKDGNKLNNVVDNLEWVTASENTIHAYENNLIERNSLNSPTRKINWEIVREIRNLSQTLSNKEISEKLLISRHIVGRVVNNKCWIE